MKKIISVLALAMLVSVAALAQEKKADNDAWREKVRAEQVAFITSELDLTEGEAQKFWPVYNEVQAKRREAYKESFDAMKAVQEDIEKGEDSGKNLDKYLVAKKKITDLDGESVKKYSKVLPKNKVAKLILSEERFRQNQIGKLGGRNGKFGQGGHGSAPEGAPQMGEDAPKGFHKGHPGAPGKFQNGDGAKFQNGNAPAPKKLHAAPKGDVTAPSAE